MSETFGGDDAEIETEEGGCGQPDGCRGDGQKLLEERGRDETGANFGGADGLGA